jgi:protein-L-isoaspartate(D-aspartate) O-methyltransferase
MRKITLGLVFALAVLVIVTQRSAAASLEGVTTEKARNQMVDEDIVALGVKNPRVIQSMRTTPRHEFVPMAQRKNAYYDMSLPIGEGQTISPPFIVAFMTESIDPQPGDKVLEIGTGSGYQAAVLSPLVKEVYTIEIVPALGKTAAAALKRLKYNNVFAKVGDGYLGWPEHAPFDKIIVTCSPEKVPQALVDQLKDGGSMVIPVGERYQQTLYLMKKTEGKMVQQKLQTTLFVPMTGKAEEGRQVKPDPLNPVLVNGNFEKTNKDDPKEIPGWFYTRQAEVVYATDAPQGTHYVTFRNDEPGRIAHTLQGVALDGRKVKQLEISLQVRTKATRLGESTKDAPSLVVSFYDENRALMGAGAVGPWIGTMPWQQVTKRIEVPPKTREAIIRIGLYGSVGEISFDAIELKALTK